MGLMTWKKEFYPESAEDCFARVGKDQRALILHSLKKWRGLLAKNVEKHKCTVDYGIISGSDYVAEEIRAIPISSDSCALCRAFISETCEKCPLYLTLGERCDDGPGSPFSIWWNQKTPQPMITALRKCLSKYPPKRLRRTRSLRKSEPRK